jgi:hypothetical protein
MVQGEDGNWQFDASQSELWTRLSATLDENQRLIRQWNQFVPRYNNTVRPRSPGRPLEASEAQIADVLKRHKAKASLRNLHPLRASLRPATSRELASRLLGSTAMPVLQSRQPASEYRSRAEQCERQAVKCKGDPAEKAHFLELARAYRKLAERTAELEVKKDR